MKYTISDIDALAAFARSFVDTLEIKNTAQVIFLRGDLGVGKTAFTKELAKALGIEETVTSPTFVVLKEYPVENHAFITNLIHIDAYRLADASELEYLHWNQYVQNPHNCIAIEWPEMVSGIATGEATTVLNFSIEKKSETRVIEVQDNV